ncbi:MAG: carbohydrate-binding family 9-like protein [Bradymonadaceae bacterium]|nr:carbohydrate-binding family 9-like protein [Lujinxingiaceae bacterium]
MRFKTLSVTAFALAGALTLSAAQMGCQEVEEPTTVLTQEQWREVKQHILDKDPSPRYKIGANFNDEIELIGFDVEEPIVAGKPATFTWYWKALKDGSQNWQIFVHFDSTARAFRQNLDHHPVNGLYQTSRWKKGQIVRDVQKVNIRANYPGGPAVPYIGFFRGESRLPIKNDVRKSNDNRVIGPTLTIQGNAAAPAAASPRYAVQLTDAEQAATLTLDGKLDEALWAGIPTLKLSPMGNAPALETVVKAFWTESHLYIGATLTDTHIWGTLTERDASLWNEEVFEVFLAPHGAEGEYVELQVSPLGTIFDAHFKARLGRGEGSRQEQIDRARAWNMEGLEVGVHVDGTVNDKSVEDKSWSIEMKIPLDQLPALKEKPEAGAVWSVNLYRFDRPQDKVSHAYGWSTEPRGDFHRIEQFGQFRFAGQGGAVAAPKLSPEAVEQLKRRVDEIKIDQPSAAQ